MSVQQMTEIPIIFLTAKTLKEDILGRYLKIGSGMN